MFVLCVSLTENEGIMEEDDFPIDVFHDYPERFGRAVDLLIPLEVGDNREIYPKKRACDGLNLGLKPGRWREQQVSWKPNYHAL